MIASSISHSKKHQRVWTAKRPMIIITFQLRIPSPRYEKWHNYLLLYNLLMFRCFFFGVSLSLASFSRWSRNKKRSEKSFESNIYPKLLISLFSLFISSPRSFSCMGLGNCMIFFWLPIFAKLKTTCTEWRRRSNWEKIVIRKSTKKDNFTLAFDNETIGAKFLFFSSLARPQKRSFQSLKKKQTTNNFNACCCTNISFIYNYFLCIGRKFVYKKTGEFSSQSSSNS